MWQLVSIWWYMAVCGNSNKVQTTVQLQQTQGESLTVHSYVKLKCISKFKRCHALGIFYLSKSLLENVGRIHEILRLCVFCNGLYLSVMC